MNNEFRKLVQNCADEGQALAKQLTNEGQFQGLYLYCEPSKPGEGSGKLTLVKDSEPAPKNLQLVTGECLHGNVEFSRYYNWIYSHATRAPIMSH